MSTNKNTYRAISLLLKEGIVISRKKFDNYLKLYNEYRYPLTVLLARIIDKKEPEFIDFIKNKIQDDAKV